MKHSLLSIAMLAVGLGAAAQTQADSTAIANAFWLSNEPSEGISYTYAAIPVFDSMQSVGIISVAPDKGLKIGIAAPDTLVHPSKLARAHGALAAMNGSYFNMKEGYSVCFLKIGDVVMDTTTAAESKLRVNAALHVTPDGAVKILDWGPEIEHAYTGTDGTVLASGPRLIADGEICDFTKQGKSFNMARHPRSALALKADGTVMLVAVDGRAGDNAAGISLPELSFMLRQLGAVDAINLDGGGSTGMWIDGAPFDGVVNYPSDNRAFDHRGERRVPNIVYIFK